jgi:hypothetical protein
MTFEELQEEISFQLGLPSRVLTSQQSGGHDLLISSDFYVLILSTS